MSNQLGFAASDALQRMQAWWRRRSRPPQELRAAVVLDRFLERAQATGATTRFLEVGCNKGEHVDHIRSRNVFGQVSCLDLSSVHKNPAHIRALYEAHAFNEPFDAIWTSHVLEHTRNPGLFLDKLHRDLREGGLLALNVPPLKHAITAGHVTLWTPGLLLLNLVKAGFDCSEAEICQVGYNIGVVLRKRTCPNVTSFAPESKHSARPYLPEGLCWFQNPRTKIWYFRGDFTAVNW